MFVLANTVANTVSSPFQRIGRIVWTPVLTESTLSIPSAFILLLLLVYSRMCRSHLVPKGEVLRNGVHFSLYPVFLP